MRFNKQRGNMYPWVDGTANPIRGCAHGCSYCYLWSTGYNMTPRIVEKELWGGFVTGKTVFVGSTCDMWGSFMKSDWIRAVLMYLRHFDNRYLFQSKCPGRYFEFWADDLWPRKVIFGTTIETNRDALVQTKAPVMIRRAIAMSSLGDVQRMVSIEPIMDFDLELMVSLVRMCKPTFVSIGADSKGHNLVEPSKKKVEELIAELSTFTKVMRKDNLRRLVAN